MSVYCIHPNNLFCQLLSTSLSDDFESKTFGGSLSLLVQTAKDSDILVIGFHQPNLVDILRSVVCPSVVLVPAAISVDENDRLIECLEYGAAALLLETIDPEELSEVLSDVHRVRRINDLIVDWLLVTLIELAREKRHQRRSRQRCELTARQLEVLNLAADGMKNKEIAKRLGVSEYTIKNHMHAVLQHLGVPSRQDAVRVAVDERWI